MSSVILYICIMFVSLFTDTKNVSRCQSTSTTTTTITTTSTTTSPTTTTPITTTVSTITTPTTTTIPTTTTTTPTATTTTATSGTPTTTASTAPTSSSTITTTQPTSTSTSTSTSVFDTSTSTMTTTPTAVSTTPTSAGSYQPNRRSIPLPIQVVVPISVASQIVVPLTSLPQSVQDQNLTAPIFLWPCTCNTDYENKMTVEQWTEWFTETQTIAKNKTSKYQRRLRSAEDARRSTVSIGIVAAVTLTGLGLLIAILDAPTVIHNLKHIHDTLKERTYMAK